MGRQRSVVRLAIASFLVLPVLAAGAPAQHAHGAPDAPVPLVAAPGEGPRALDGVAQRPEGLVDWRVTGRVVSAAGEPVAGAEVAFVPGFEQLVVRRQWTRGDAADHLRLIESLVRTRTGSDGRFVLLARHPLVSDAYASYQLRGESALRNSDRLADWSFLLPQRSLAFHPQVFVAARGHGATARFASLWQGEADVGEIRLEPAFEVKGRLVDENGAGLAGATVLTRFIAPARDKQPDAVRRFSGSGLASHLQARTGADGSFTLEGLPPGKPKCEAVTAQGVALRVDVRDGVRTASGVEQVLLVGTRDSWRLAGSVVGPDGAAMAGVHVRLGALDDATGFVDHDWLLSGPDGSIPDPVGANEMLTDGNGRFTFDVPRERRGAARLQVSALAAGHAPVVYSYIEPDSGDLTLQFAPPAGLLLVVRDKDSGQALQALAGQAMLFGPSDEGAAVSPTVVLVGPAALHAASAFGIQGTPGDIDPAACLLVVGIVGAETAVQVQAVGGGTRVFRFPALEKHGALQHVDLPAGYTLHAWVSDGIRTAVPGARLTLEMDWGYPRAVLSGWTDTDGRLHLHDVYSTRHMVSISAPGHVPVRGFELWMTPKIGTFTFPTPATGAIAGRVHLPEGVSPSGVVVQLNWQSPGPDTWGPWYVEPDHVVVLAGDDGRFLATGLPHGKWTATTDAGGSAETSIAWGELGSMDLRVAEPSLLRIRLADADGQPLEGIFYALDAVTKDVVLDARTRAPAYGFVQGDASVEVRLKASARCVIRAMLPSGVVYDTEPFALEPGEERELVVRVPDLGGLEVRFIGEDGLPCPAAGLLFDGRALTATSRRGDISCYAGLPSGVHVLQAVSVAGNEHAEIAVKSGVGLGRELDVSVPARGVARDVVLVAPRPARVTVRWDRDLSEFESVWVKVGPTNARVSESDDDPNRADGEPAIRSITVDVLPGEYEIRVELSAPGPEGIREHSVVIKPLELTTLQVRLASGEEHVIEQHLP